MASKTVCSFLIIDFETSGLDCRKHCITEVAAIALNGATLQEIDRYEDYAAYGYDPTLVYDDKALSITGITIETLIEYGKPIKEIVDNLISLFEKSNKHCEGKFSKSILIGHNLGFDIGFLQAIFAHCKKDLSKYLAGQKDFYGNFQPSFIDTVTQARMKFQDDDTMMDFKLGTFVEKVGLDLIDAHRAMNDVSANKDAFLSLINDYRVDNAATIQTNKARFRNHFKM